MTNIVYLESYQVKLRWAAGADAILQTALKDIYPNGVPGDIGDAWYKFVTARSVAYSDLTCEEWFDIFDVFVNSWLTFQESYEEAVEAMMDRMVG